MSEIERKYAGFWMRAIALLVDQMIIGFMLGLVMLSLTFFTVVTSVDSIKETVDQVKIDLDEVSKNSQNDIDNPNGAQPTIDDVIENTIENDPTISKIDTLFGPIYYGLYIIVSIFYHAILEASKFQGSIGKFALRIRVIKLDGTPEKFARALTRNLMAWVLGSLTLGIGHLMAGWNKRRRALHDYVAGTIVIIQPR